MLWRGLQAQGLYMLPPLSQGLQPSLSDTLDVWRGVLSGAAGKLEEHYDVLDKQLRGRPSIRQSLVRAFQVPKAPVSGGCNVSRGHRLCGRSHILNGLSLNMCGLKICCRMMGDPAGHASFCAVVTGIIEDRHIE